MSMHADTLLLPTTFPKAQTTVQAAQADEPQQGSPFVALLAQLFSMDASAQELSVLVDTDTEKLERETLDSLLEQLHDILQQLPLAPFLPSTSILPQSAVGPEHSAHPLTNPILQLPEQLQTQNMMADAAVASLVETDSPVQTDTLLASLNAVEEDHVQQAEGGTDALEPAPTGKHTENLVFGANQTETQISRDVRSTSGDTSTPRSFTPLTSETAARIVGFPLPRNTILLQVEPPELGLMQIQIRLLDEHLTATFWSESSEVRSLLQAHLPSLHRTIEQQGFQADEISFNFVPDSFTGQGSQFAHQHPRHLFTPPETHQSLAPFAPNAAPDQRNSRGNLPRQAGGIDVVI